VDIGHGLAASVDKLEANDAAPVRQMNRAADVASRDYGKRPADRSIGAKVHLEVIVTGFKPCARCGVAVREPVAHGHVAAGVVPGFVAYPESANATPEDDRAQLVPVGRAALR